MTFLTIAESAHLEHQEPYSNVKTVICSKYSFLKLTQFSQVNNVLEALDSATDACPRRNIYVSSP
jgi:hypothetical protein